MEYKDDDLTFIKYQQAQAEMMGYLKTEEASAGYLQIFKQTETKLLSRPMSWKTNTELLKHASILKYR